MINLLKPSVNKKVLIVLSGLLWSSVGILLNKFAFKWFDLLTNIEIFIVIPSGLLLGTGITVFGFKKMAIKNINRINSMPDKVCVFAFQEWKTYLLIIFMMSLGLFMRTTNFIPKLILSTIYIGIGFALFISGLQYYKFLLNRKER